MITFKKNNRREFKGRKRKKIESAPTNAPFIQANKETCRFNK